MDDRQTVVCALAVLFMLIAGSKGETCTTSSYYDYFSNSWVTETTSCNSDCCGDYPYEYCCDNTWLVWVIVGSVLGGILTISVIIALVCVCMKKQSHQGRVVHPAHTPAVHTTVAVSGISGQYPMQNSGQYSMYPGGQQPPVYPPPPPPLAYT